MKVLIIGYGSIGKRHYDILSNIKKISTIKIISKVKLLKKIKIEFSKKEIIKYNPDYIIISSATNMHYNHLRKVNSYLNNKIILIEKPLFINNKKTIIKKNNKIVVGYNMRFNPILKYLKSFVEDNKSSLLNINLYCGSYLPNWRPDNDYRKSYSSNKFKGGGVGLDLSHEFDYITWIFGKFKKINIINKKISNLSINSNDHLMLNARFGSNTFLNITLNYYSHIPHRYLIIDFNDCTLHVDIINYQIKIKYNDRDLIIKKWTKNDRNTSYTKMHKSIINNKFENICSYNHALEYLNII